MLAPENIYGTSAVNRPASKSRASTAPGKPVSALPSATHPQSGSALRSVLPVPTGVALLSHALVDFLKASMLAADFARKGFSTREQLQKVPFDRFASFVRNFGASIPRPQAHRERSGWPSWLRSPGRTRISSIGSVFSLTASPAALPGFQDEYSDHSLS